MEAGGSSRTYSRLVTEVSATELRLGMEASEPRGGQDVASLQGMCHRSVNLIQIEWCRQRRTKE